MDKEGHLLATKLQLITSKISSAEALMAGVHLDGMM